MRLTIFSLFTALMLTGTGWGAGIVAGGVIGGGDDGGGGYSDPVPMGDDLTLTAVVLNGATDVQFGVYDSHNNLVYVSSTVPVQEDTVTMSWSPPFADTFTVYAISYENGQELSREQVLVAAAYQPESSGFITGGGFLQENGGRQTFGFVAQVQRNGSIRGSLEYQDHAMRFNFKSFMLDWVYAPSRSEGYFSGRCTLNGAGDYRFFVQVFDMGEPGSDDFFGLWIYDGGSMIYASYGTLGSGNIKIHSR